MNINSLKNLTLRNVTLEEAMAARAELKLLATSYEENKITIPDWIGEKIIEIEKEIKDQVRSERLATLKKLEARRAALMTTDEKRKALDDEISMLKTSMN